MKKILLSTALLASLNAHAILGPIHITNTEYRTNSPVIGSIASTLKFDESDIKATGANTFLDFLATVPSIGLVNPQGGVPAVFMRGGNSEHTLFLVDGVSINDISSPNGAIANRLSNIMLNDIKTVEIIKNSGSVLYGSSAVAGVIAITTKQGTNEPSAKTSVQFSSNNAKTYTLSAADGHENSFVRFSHRQYKTDGINATTVDTTGEKDGIDNVSTQIKTGNKFFDISYLESRNKTQYDGYASDSGELADSELSKAVLNLNKNINTNWVMKLSLAKTQSKRDNGIKASTIGDKFNSTVITLLNDIKIDGALLNVGVSKNKDENSSDNKNLSSKDWFINWQKNISSIDLNAGVRYINHSKFGKKSVYSLGLAKYINNSVKLTGSYATAFNAPSLYQIYDPAGNLNLDPETSKNLELGIEKYHYWGQSSIRVYKNKMKNRIAYDGVYNAGVANYFNNGELNNDGVDINIDATINDYLIIFGHNYNKSISSNNGQTKTGQSARRPKNTSQLSIGKIYGKFDSTVQIIKKSSSLDDTIYDGLGDFKLKGYTLVNLATQYSYNPKTTVFFNINNAFDTDYTVVQGYNELGKTISLRMDYNF